MNERIESLDLKRIEAAHREAVAALEAAFEARCMAELEARSRRRRAKHRKARHPKDQMHATAGSEPAA
jgi:hypothetical protein